MKWHCNVRRGHRIDAPPMISSANGDGGGAAVAAAVMVGEKNHNKYDASYSSLTQLAAWGLPALQTVAVLAARLVDADELLGKFISFKENIYKI